MHVVFGAAGALGAAIVQNLAVQAQPAAATTPSLADACAWVTSLF